MRLGSTMMAVGIVLLIIGAALPATTTTTQPSADCTWVGQERICGQETVEEPNQFRSLVLLVGGFVFSGGWGGWIGTYSTEQRLEDRLDELGVQRRSDATFDQSSVQSSEDSE